MGTEVEGQVVLNVEHIVENTIIIGEELVTQRGVRNEVTRGEITIGHDVTLCIDVTEHGTDNITLTLLTFVADDSSRLAGDLIGSITGIVVIDIDGRFRKNALEVFYNLFDGLALIVARNHNCNLIHDSPHFLKLS